MAKRHVDEYFNHIVSDYKEMLDTLHDLEKECNEGLVSPDNLEQMKQMIIPLKNNYMTISWIMYLLNMPNKEKKRRKYEQVQLPIMNEIDPNKERTLESITEEDKEIIEKLKISLQ